MKNMKVHNLLNCVAQDRTVQFIDQIVLGVCIIHDCISISLRTIYYMSEFSGKQERISPVFLEPPCVLNPQAHGNASPQMHQHCFQCRVHEGPEFDLSLTPLWICSTHRCTAKNFAGALTSLPHLPLRS